MSNRIRIEVKYGSEVEFKNNEIITSQPCYDVHVACDGISAWVGSGSTLESAILDINGGDDNCLLSKLPETLSQDELECIEAAWSDDNTVFVFGANDFDGSKPVTLDNILKGIAQE